PLVQAEQVSHIGIASLIRRLTVRSTIQTDDTDGARVDHALAVPMTSSLKNIKDTSDIDVVEVPGSLRPEPIERGQVEDEAGTLAGGEHGIGISHVDSDALQVEAPEIPFVASRLDQGHDTGAAGKKGADNS